MQTMIQRTCDQAKDCSRHASSAPISANGSANTEWLKRMNERYARTLVMISSNPKNQTKTQKELGIWSLGFGIFREPRDRRRLDPREQVFFHVLHFLWHAHDN